MSTILVTGASGQLGQLVLKALENSPHKRVGDYGFKVGGTTDFEFILRRSF